MSFKQQQKKSAVKRMTIKLGELEDSKFEKSDLIEVLADIPFSLININLSAKKSYVGVNGLGYTSVGYVNGFDRDTLEFDVVIFANRVDEISKLGELFIGARAFTNADNQITKIISLDIEPVK